MLQRWSDEDAEEERLKQSSECANEDENEGDKTLIIDDEDEDDDAAIPKVKTTSRNLLKRKPYLNHNYDDDDV